MIRLLPPAIGPIGHVASHRDAKPHHLSVRLEGRPLERRFEEKRRPLFCAPSKMSEQDRGLLARLRRWLSRYALCGGSLVGLTPWDQREARPSLRTFDETSAAWHEYGTTPRSSRRLAAPHPGPESGSQSGCI